MNCPIFALVVIGQRTMTPPLFLESRIQMTTTATQISDAVQRRFAATQSEFDRLATAMADDAQLDPDTVAESLHRLERSAEDLSDAADLIAQRRGWAADLAKVQSLDADQTRLATAAAELERAFKADLILLKAKFQSAMDRNAAESRIVDAGRERASTGRVRLVDTSRQFAELKKLWATSGALTQKLRDAQHELRHDSDNNAPNTSRRIDGILSEQAALATKIQKLEAQALTP